MNFFVNPFLRVLAAMMIIGYFWTTLSANTSPYSVARAQAELLSTGADGQDAASIAAEQGVITLEFFHAMGGGNGIVLQQLVDRYNASQTGVVVNVSFKGSYEDTYASLLAALAAGNPPNVVQNFDLATQQTLDSVPILPVHELMAAEGYDPDVFIPAVRDYYSTLNGMAAMAFNSSTPILYYNNELLQSAGSTTPGPDWTFADLSRICQELKDANVVPNCFAFGTVGWFFEQILANSGGHYFDQANGRAGRAQSVLFDQGQGIEVFGALTGLIQDGYAPDLGADWGAPNDLFLNQQVAMIIGSSSNVRYLQDNAAFTVGTTYIPHSNSSSRNGAVVGGAALWLIDTGDDAESAAAWDFLKFMAAPTQQIDWHRDTGYIPVRADLLNNAELVNFWNANPNFRTAVDQLITTETKLSDGTPNYAVLGGRAGPFPQIRQHIVAAYRRVLDDGLSVTLALDEAAVQADLALGEYRETSTGEIPKEGTELSFHGNNMRYGFAPGTFDDPVMLSYEVGFPDPILDRELLGIGITFDASVVPGVSAAVLTPSQPYTMSVQYVDAQLGVIAEDSLAFYYLDGAAWIKEPSSYVDPISNVLVANPVHFSRWTVGGESERAFVPLVVQ